MKHKRLIITLTCLVFVAVSIICFLQLFSVRDINVIYSVAKEDSVEDVVTLVSKYKRKNIFSIDTEKIKEEITADKYLKVISVEKKYPNEIVIKLNERIEKYYYVADDGVYYFDDEYFIVRKSDEVNGNNLTELTFENINGEKIAVNCQLKSTFVMPENLNSNIDKCFEIAKSPEFDVEHNIKRAGVVFTEEQGNYRLEFSLVEGVSIEIMNANEKFEEKMKKGIAHYLSLSEDRKIKGIVVVVELNSGEIVAKHTTKR